MSESLTEIFRRTVRMFGGRPAVAGAGKVISYADLDSRSDEIAAVLRRLGIGPRARVGLFRRKDIDTVAGIYAILKVGAAYVLIDNKMGPERLAAVLNDADLAALVTDPVLTPKLQTLMATGLTPWLANATAEGDVLRIVHPGRSSSGLDDPASADSAYILYTSGSTGMPKGVQHTHASALAFVNWAANYFDISSKDRLSCHAAFHFDLTVFDLFAAALTGACVVLIPDESTVFPLQVASIMATERITVWYSVPFALIQLLRHGSLESRRLALREVIFAGERFPPTELRRLATLLPSVTLTNLFGPTETNVCTYHRLSADDLASDEYCPIGTACSYASIVVESEKGGPAKPGEMGELLVGGSSVMTGYLNRPELNSQVFVNREADGQVERFFRTGDLVTSPADGPIRFHGRRDRQVKVRGFRIELDEIETALAKCAGVIASAAWVHIDSTEFAEIRAAVVLDPASEGLTGDDLILHARRRLPLGGVPAQISVLRDLPRTVNGKVDYAILQGSLR